MKQYLTNEQSLRLRSMGYPVRVHFVRQLEYAPAIPVYTYSVGDLMEFIPVSLGFSDGNNPVFGVRKHNGFWKVGYQGILDIQERELIDALYEIVLSRLVFSRSKAVKK